MTKELSFLFLEPGFKLLIVHRRLFAEDEARYFVGAVDAFNENSGLLRITGYTWAQKKDGTYVKKSQPRTKIVALGSGSVLVYVLPRDTDIQKSHFDQDERGVCWLTDHGSLKLDLTESAGVS